MYEQLLNMLKNKKIHRIFATFNFVMILSSTNSPYAERSSASVLLNSSIISANDLLGLDREEIFQQFKHQIIDAYYFPKKTFIRLNTTWEKELHWAHKRFLEAQSSEDVYYAIISLLKSLRDDHVTLEYVPSEVAPRPSRIKLSVIFSPVFSNNKWEFRVLKSDDPSVLPNSKLVNYNGKNFNELMEETREWVNKNEGAMVYWTSRWLWLKDSTRLPLTDIKKPVQLVLTHPITNKNYVESVFWSSEGAIPQSEIFSKIFFDHEYADKSVLFRGINYKVYDLGPRQGMIIRYTSFSYTHNPKILKDQIQSINYKSDELELLANREQEVDTDKVLEIEQKKLIEWLTRNQPTKVVLDLRENNGGGLNVQLITAFAKQPVQTTTSEFIFTKFIRDNPSSINTAIGYSKRRAIIKDEFAQIPPLQKSSRRPFYCLTEKCTLDEATIENTGELKEIPFFVLIGPQCISACDQFSSILKSNKVGKLIGMSTSGSTAPFRVTIELNLKNRMKILAQLPSAVNYDPDEKPIEGHPIKPDIVIRPTPMNYFDYLNALLEATSIEK